MTDVKDISEELKYDEVFEGHPIMTHNTDTMRSRGSNVNRIFGIPGPQEQRHIFYADGTHKQVSQEAFNELWIKATNWKHGPVYTYRAR